MNDYHVAWLAILVGILGVVMVLARLDSQKQDEAITALQARVQVLEEAE